MTTNGAKALPWLPHVTGAISLFQAIEPDLTRYEIIELMRSTGRSCANCQGRKSLNAGAALTMLKDGELPTFEDDEYTDNQTPEGAAQLTCDTTLNLKMTPGDEDWFVLTNPQGFMVEVKIIADDVSQDLDLYVNDGNIQNGNLSQSTSPDGEESVISSTITGRFILSSCPTRPHVVITHSK